jgi:hypothetical protein
MRKILVAVLLVLAMAIPAFAQHDGPSEMIIKELDAGDVGVAAAVAPKTKVYGMWGQKSSGGYYYMTNKYDATSDCCTNFTTWIGIGKDANYTIKVIMLELDATGTWVPAREGWPGFGDPMKWITKNAPYTAGYYSIAHHVHFLNSGQKQYKVQIMRPSDGAILAQNTMFFDVYE